MSASRGVAIVTLGDRYYRFLEFCDDAPYEDNMPFMIDPITGKHFTELPAHAGRLASENDRLRAALERYGRHTGICHFLGGKDCNCGWESVKRSLAGP